VTNNVYRERSNFDDNYQAAALALTNANCVFACNIVSNATGAAYGWLSNGKVQLNSTFVGNWMKDAGNYGGFVGGQLVNSVFTDNMFYWSKEKFDFRVFYTWSTNRLVATNCLFGKLQNGVTLGGELAAGAVDCKLGMARLKDGFKPGFKSQAKDAGLTEQWVIDTLGDTDIYGQPRVNGTKIDMGAAECVATRPDPFLIIYK